jgi:hypothetical protein
VLSRNDFSIKKSTIKGAGKGLFTKTLIHPGDTIGPYTGKILTDWQTLRKPYIDSVYILTVCHNHNILGEGSESNHTRYINHKEKPNGRIVTSNRWKTARIEAIKMIRPGQEVFIHYGPDYWST